ncbi:MAG: DUF485 domain-containing protein [Candidatus Aminicenantes bacterium]|nr:DUF485 domain-containing protein [Candidatus Aminicenantes bacterium]
MQQHEAVELGEDKAAKFKSRVGLILFGVYSFIYAGFVFINTWSPETMGIKVAFGLNLAVFYGFFLIILAIVMGIIYNHYCTKMENKLNGEEEENKE